jgi:protein-ribulosamine 3-kinase
MSELFGGYSNEFYRGYNSVFPLDKGYETRKSLYHLYHILNHFNLFGGHYQNQAMQLTQSLLRESHSA